MGTVREDKAKITKELLKLLAMTSEYEDLEELEYVKDKCNEEWVIGTFASGYTRRICVTANSGIALIRQVAAEM